MVLTGQDKCINKHEYNDKPVKKLRLHNLVDLLAEHQILMQDPGIDAMQTAEHSSLHLDLALTLLFAHVIIHLLVLQIQVFLITLINFGLADPGDVVLIGVVDQSLLFQLLQVTTFLGLLSLLGELTRQHTQNEIHDEE